MASGTSNSAANPASKMRVGDIVLDDPAISLAAKGVFVTVGLLGGSCDLAQLASHCADDGALRAAVEELAEHSYVSLQGDQVQLRDLASLGLPD